MYKLLEGENFMAISNFVVFNSTIKHGQMNTGINFYPAGLDSEERTRLMREHKGRIAKEVGFDINKIFMALQANKKHPYHPGTCYTLTKEDVSNYDDLYAYDVWADMVKITGDTPNCVIGFNVSDAPNVIAMNVKTNEAVSAFCSVLHINKEVPSMIKSTLGGNPEDIIVSVSPFMHLYPWITDSIGVMPPWMSNEAVWADTIESSQGSFLLINLKKALLRQLTASGILESHIIMGEDSFFRADQYYSTRRAQITGDNSQDGRFMHGVLLRDANGSYSDDFEGKSYIKRI